MNESENKIKEVTTHYIKTPSYKTVHADGFFGGLTPKGKVYFEPFMERFPTPKEITLMMDEKSELAVGEKKEESKEGIIRHIECGVIMDIEVCKALKTWCENILDQHKKVFERRNNSE